MVAEFTKIRGHPFRVQYEGRCAATFVDKVLKGRTPADLPVGQSIKFEFIAKLKTAKQIGLMIPPNVLVWAARVIE